MRKSLADAYNKVFVTTRLTFWDRFFLVLPGVPNMLANLLVQSVLFKYFTDVVGLDPLLVGTVWMVLGIWNAVNDPLAGIYLDRKPYDPQKGKYVRMARRIFPLVILEPSSPHSTKRGDRQCYN